MHARELLGTRRVAHVHPVRERAEPRDAAVVESHHLGVEEQVVAQLGEGLQLGVGGGDVVLVARRRVRSRRGLHSASTRMPSHLTS